MTKDYLQAVREREQKATKGPWEFATELYDNPSGPFESWPVGPKQTHTSVTQFGMPVFPEQLDHDADFIAHARTDIPNLLDYIDRLERALEKCKEQRDLAHFGFCYDFSCKVLTGYNAELDEILKGEK